MPNGIQYPYGDVFLVNTPSIDKVSQQLFAEQKQREIQRAQQQQALDNEFRKNVATIKDADVPEYVQKYEDWKRSRQDLMKMSPTKDKQAYISKQMESQRKLADAYQLANNSKQVKAEDEDIFKGIAKNPNDYEDNAYDLLAARRKTPTSQLSQYKDANGNVIDLSNPNTFRYKGIDFDASKLFKDAKGIPQQRYTKEEAAPNDDLQTKMTPYFFGSSPTDYATSIASGLSTRSGQKFAENQWDNMQPEVIDQVQKAYKDIPKDKWLQMTGNEKGQDLTIKEDDPKTVKFAKHMAQLYAINEQPEIRTPQFKLNQQKKDQRDFEQGKTLAYIRQQTASMNSGGQQGQQQGRGNAFDSMPDAVHTNYYIKDGVWYNNNGTLVNTETGQTFIDKKDIPATWISALKSANIPIDKVRDGVYATVKDGHIQTIYHEKIGKVTREAMEGVYQPKMDTEPLRGQRLQFGRGGQQQHQPSGDSYSRSELLNSGKGWTNEKINAAVKAGKIKVHD